MPTDSRRDTGALEHWLSADLSGRFDSVLAETVPDELLALAWDATPD